MRWSCPHCGTRLTTTEEKVGAAWTFSRCYTCSGTAMVRKPDIEIVKVDWVPSNERVITAKLAEATVESPKANPDLEIEIRQVSVARLENEEKPIIRRSLRQILRNEEARVSTPRIPTTPTQAPSQIQEAPAKTALPPKFVPKTEARENSTKLFPEPLPEIPESDPPARLKSLPIALGIGAALAVGSGVYFYIEARILLQRTRTTAAIEALQKAATEAAAKPVASSIAPSDSLAAVQAAALSADTLDNLAHRANAPARTPEIPAQTRAPQSTDPRTKTAATVPASVPTQLQLRVKTAYLHSGPGIAFPVIGSANPEITYRVVQSRDRWSKIAVTDTQQAWIRNDLVRMLSTQR